VRPALVRVIQRVAYQHNSASDIDDLLQEVSLKLIGSGPTILGSLPSDSTKELVYFSVIAANCARDVFRARRAARRSSAATVSLDTSLSGIAENLGVVGDFDQDLLLAKIESLLPPDRREQIVYRLYYRQGLTAKEISSLPALNLSVKGVESMIYRITKQIRERLLGVHKPTVKSKRPFESSDVSLSEDH